MYLFAGLRDYTSFLALHSVIDFWEAAAGASTLRQYMYNLARKAGIICHKNTVKP